MAGKRHKPEEIVTRLRRVKVLQGQGSSVLDATRLIGSTEATTTAGGVSMGACGRTICVGRRRLRGRSSGHSWRCLTRCSTGSFRWRRPAAPEGSAARLINASPRRRAVNHVRQAPRFGAPAARSISTGQGLDDMADAAGTCEDDAMNWARLALIDAAHAAQLAENGRPKATAERLTGAARIRWARRHICSANATQHEQQTAADVPRPACVEGRDGWSAHGAFLTPSRVHEQPKRPIKPGSAEPCDRSP